jgi:hypothetical protein
MSELKFDQKCIPYPRKGLYWMINLPFIVLFILTAIYLWKINIVISSIYISFYIISVFSHAYICSFSECPYVGTMCPGAFGWFPVGKIAMFCRKLKMKKSDSLINFLFLLILISLVGMIALPPIYWLNKLSFLFRFGYFVLVLIYFIAFILMICPKCAGRLNCPTAKLSNIIYKGVFKKDILKFR